MSALRPKADMFTTETDVCSAPTADHAACDMLLDKSKRPLLIVRLVDANEPARRFI
jgi:hypothetical protein